MDCFIPTERAAIINYSKLEPCYCNDDSSIIGVKVGATLIICDHDKCVLSVYRVYVIVAS